jgi:hypothetical protein
MAARNADVPHDRRIAFRFGVAIGDVIVDGDDASVAGVAVPTYSGGHCAAQP